MTNFQFFLAKYNLDIYIFNIYLLKVKIFKKIKCKFAVKDEVRLLSLKVIHYPNIALYQASVTEQNRWRPTLSPWQEGPRTGFLSTTSI